MLVPHSLHTLCSVSINPSHSQFCDRHHKNWFEIWYDRKWLKSCAMDYMLHAVLLFDSANLIHTMPIHRAQRTIRTIFKLLLNECPLTMFVRSQWQLISSNSDTLCSTQSRTQPRRAAEWVRAQRLPWVYSSGVSYRRLKRHTAICEQATNW